MSFPLFCRLYDAAVYLGMNAVSMLLADKMMEKGEMNVFPDLVDYAEQSAEQSGSAYILEECLMHNATNFTVEAIARLRPHQLETLVKSETLNLTEEQILHVVFIWNEASPHKALVEIPFARDLIQSHIRLPFVPHNADIMEKVQNRSPTDGCVHRAAASQFRKTRQTGKNSDVHN